MVIKLPRSRESTPVAVTPPSTTLGKYRSEWGAAPDGSSLSSAGSLHSPGSPRSGLHSPHAPRRGLFVAKGSVESTHKVPTSHYHTKHCEHCHLLRKGQLKPFVAKGSVESTHKVPTSHLLRKGQLNRPSFILYSQSGFTARNLRMSRFCLSPRRAGRARVR